MRVTLMMLVIGCITANLMAQVPNAETQTTTKHDEARDLPNEKQINKKPMSFWMEKKLDYSSDMLRGLASEDFESVKNSAIQMRLLSKVEGFVRRRNPDYRTNLHTFQRLVSEVAEQADKQNIDGVALAFNQLTVSCVRCHQTLREHATDIGQPIDSPTTAKEAKP